MGFSIKTAAWALTSLLLVLGAELILTPSIDLGDELSVSLPRFAYDRAHGLMSQAQVERVFRTRLQGHARVSAASLSRHLLKLCREFRFDPAFVLSVIETESRFHAQARSPAGAIGLMQLMPATAAWVRGHDSWRALFGEEPGIVITELLVDPYENLTLGVVYLSYLRDRYKSASPLFLLSAYRMGPARMDALLKQATQGRWVPEGDELSYYNRIRRGGARRFRVTDSPGAPHV